MRRSGLEGILITMKNRKRSRAGHITRRTHNRRTTKESGNPDIVKARTDREPGGEVELEHLVERDGAH